MTELPDFHGPHVDPRRAGAGRVDWSKPVPRFDRVRVLRHTCECKARIYELCVAGGLAWIRQTDRLESVPVVRESAPRPLGEVEEVWKKLLAGQVR